MNRKAAGILFIMGAVAWQSGCGSRREPDCADQIKEEIHPGLRQEIAEASLQKCGFKTTIDPVKKTLSGDKRVAAGLVIERTQVLIELDSNNRVATVSFARGLIGP
ncbi:MAG: hypothetical protein ABSF40_10860 [Candidatus Acidiferrales bacterium]